MPAALLIIDVQTVMCVGDSAMFDIERVIDRINTVTAKARDADVPVIFIQHEEAEEPMRYGTDGWQLDRRLDVRPDDRRIRKTACDSFDQTDLLGHLQSLGVTQLVACGLQTDFCVNATVRGALAHGYPVTLIGDAHSTIGNETLTAEQIIAHHNATLASLGSAGLRVAVMPAADVRFD